MEKKHIITIAGKPGSGKSTTANLVAHELGYRRFSSGDFMREMAKERGLTLAELQAQNDPKNDEYVDQKLRDIGTTQQDLVIDSRLAFHWIPGAFKVFLELDFETAAHRIYTHQIEHRRTMGEIVESFDTFLSSLTTRFAWEQQNYQKLYGVDPTDHGHYNLILDTSANAPEAVAHQIVAAYRDWLTP